jgi:hypothetical protein
MQTEDADLSPALTLLTRSVLQVPWVLNAPCIGPARSHPALFKGAEAAVAGAAVVGTPRTIDLGSAWPRIDDRREEKGEQDAGRTDHGDSPNCPICRIDCS